MATDSMTQTGTVPASMYCNYCRQLNPNDAVYCRECGRTIRSSAGKTEQTGQLAQAIAVHPKPLIAATKGDEASRNAQPITSPAIAPAFPTDLHSPNGRGREIENISDEELPQRRASYGNLESQALQQKLEKRTLKDNISAKSSMAGQSDTVVRLTPTCSATQVQPAISDVAANYQPVRNNNAPYGSLISALICFTLLITLWMFSLVLATTAGSPDGFSKGSPPLIGVIVMAIWARGAWAKIMIAEPNSNPHFRRKHTSFNLKAGGLIAASILTAGGYGAHLGLHKARVNEHLEEIRVLGEKAAPIKKQFIEIVRRNTHTTPEYLQWTKDLEVSLSEYEPLVQQMDSLLTVVQQDYKSDSKTAEAFSTMRSLLQKDLQSMHAFREEIESAKRLEELPAEEQSQFHKEHIEPIQAEEHRIAMEEIEILKNAKARGIKLPEELYEQAGIK